MYRPIDTGRWTPAEHARGPDAYYSGEPLRIGTSPQLLAHRALVEDRRAVTRRVTQPQRTAGPVVQPEHPWEQRGVSRAVVLADGGSGVRMWYGTNDSLLYAESDDGLSWSKPALGIVPDSSGAATNVVYRGTNDRCSAYALVRDPAEPDASRRFKLLYKGGKGRDGIISQHLAFSADGLHWRPFEGNPVMPQRHDCNGNLVLDTDRGIWMTTVRPYVFGSGIWPEQKVDGVKLHHRRRVAICESPDLARWTKVRTVLKPDEDDQNELDHITVFPWHDMLVGFVGIFGDRARDGLGTGHYREQRHHIEVAFSLDGHHWDRAPGPFLEPSGVTGDFDRDSVDVGNAALVDDSGELLIFYSGSSWDMPRQHRTCIGLLRTVRDRFVEQHAAEEGWLLTREFLLEGDALEVNCRAAGSIAVELAEYPGRPAPGYALADCDPIVGDHRARRVTWRGRGDLRGVRGRPIYVRFRLRNAGVWSFTVRS